MLRLFDAFALPHHVHLPDQRTPAPSTITNLEDLLTFLAKSSQSESE